MQQPIAVSPAAEGGMRTFVTIWLGQLVSSLGSMMTRYALIFWVFEQSRSATQQSLVSFFALLPALLLTPLAGVVADRWDRQRVMMIGVCGAALSSVGLSALLLAGQLQIWHVYLLVLNSSAFGVLGAPSFTASIALLVPKAQFSRINSMVEVGGSLCQIAAPALAGVLLGWVGLVGLVIFDLLTFVIWLCSLLVVRIPRPAPSESARGSFRQAAAYGWQYLRQRPGMLNLLLFFAISNYVLATVTALASPLVLAFASTAQLGLVLSASGFGMLAGGVLMSLWGGPRRPLYAVFGGLLLSALAMIAGGLGPSLPLITAASFCIAAGIPLVISSTQSLWQQKVALDVQGRVFAIRQMIVSASAPLAFLVSGPLVDYVFEPLMARGGPLAASAGALIGVGPGRGVGLMMILLGLLLIAIVVVGYLSPRLWAVEELPDAVAA